MVNTMDAFYCVETLKTAIDLFGKPVIFNSDQGSQFTSAEFIAELRAHDIPESAWMDGDAAWIMQKWSASGGP